MNIYTVNPEAACLHQPAVLRIVLAPSGHVRKSGRDEVTHPFWENVGKWRAAPEAAEYSLATTTAASERRRRWQHQGLFLPHPPDCPRMNEQSGTHNHTRARAQQTRRKSKYLFFLSDIFIDALRREYLLVTTSDRCLSLIHKIFSFEFWR